MELVRPPPKNQSPKTDSPDVVGAVCIPYTHFTPVPVYNVGGGSLILHRVPRLAGGPGLEV